jgi:protein-arginine deiminase
VHTCCKAIAVLLAVWSTASCKVSLPATRWGGDTDSASVHEASSDGSTDPTMFDGEPRTNLGLAVLTDTNRDGVVDDNDSAGLTDWSWKGLGAFLVANVDDDDRKGRVDASDQVVNGPNDEKDLAPIIIKLAPDIMAKTTAVAASVNTGTAQTHLFENTTGGWKLVSGSLSELASEIQLGIEAVKFADTVWDGFVTVTVDVLGPKQASIASQQVRMRVAPWIMLPNSAKTRVLYISSQTSRLRTDVGKVLAAAGLPDAQASSPPGQDIWFQDTMEIGYTQLPGRPAMYVAMNGQRPNASDNLAITLLGQDFGFISIGTPRQPADAEDYFIDWMSNLDVTHPVPGYPLGRIYYGSSDRTTFQPSIVEFLEAQEVQAPFSLDVNWLLLQQVDEIMTFVPDQNGKAKMLIVSPAAASAVMGSGFDAGNQRIQGYIDDDITLAKAQLGLSDDDIVRFPAFFSGGGTEYATLWANPVNAVYLDGTLMIGATNTPAAVKVDIESKLGAIGIRAAWVDDSEYDPYGGNVHSATNTARLPLCASFTDCLTTGLTP